MKENESITDNDYLLTCDFDFGRIKSDRIKGKTFIDTYNVYGKLVPHCEIVLNDISEGMLRDTRREIAALEQNASVKNLSSTNSASDTTRFTFDAFDCHSIPYGDQTFDLIIANHILFYYKKCRYLCL